ncbi:MAG: hypothetical protein SWK76_15355 [Actinomycetota bacterium]|nr:hypothetical protein [Actinomycetota bacterium]
MTDEKKIWNNTGSTTTAYYLRSYIGILIYDLLALAVGYVPFQAARPHRLWGILALE